MNIVQKQKAKAASGPLLTPKRKKYLYISLASLAGVALIVYGSVLGYDWLKRNPSKPKEDAKPVEVAKFIASDSFNKLPLVEKEEYLQKLRSGGGDPRETFKNMDQGARESFMQKSMEVRDARQRKTAKEYCSLSKEDREKWIANYVAEQDKRRAEMRARFGQMRGPGGPGGPGGQPQMQGQQGQGQPRAQGQGRGPRGDN